MLPRDKVAIVEAVDHLKPDAELVDVPIEPGEQRRGGKRVEGHLRAGRPGDSGSMQIPSTHRRVNRPEEIPRDAMFLPETEDLLGRPLQGRMAPPLHMEVGSRQCHRIMAQAASDVLPGLAELGIQRQGLQGGIGKGVDVPRRKHLLDTRVELVI